MRFKYRYLPTKLDGFTNEAYAIVDMQTKIILSRAVIPLSMDEKRKRQYRLGLMRLVMLANAAHESSNMAKLADRLWQEGLPGSPLKYGDEEDKPVAKKKKSAHKWAVKTAKGKMIAKVVKQKKQKKGKRK